MSKLSIAQFIKEFYPNYYQWHEYAVDECVTITTNEDKWGILGNLYATPLDVDGVQFASSEQLFQMMKFTDKEILLDLYRSRGMAPKMKSKKNEKLGLRRPDWGQIIVDVMKFCLQTKYDQSEAFRQTLKETAGKTIVEDQSSRKTIKTVDTWGAVKVDDKFIGSNLLGRLLMELRDNGKLEYHLPENMFDFLQNLR